MAQDAIANVPFFPDAQQLRRNPSDRAGVEGSAEPAAGKPAKESEFAQTLGKTSVHRQRQKESVKMDKPKHLNREPFFPTTPMPYHPDPATQPVVRADHAEPSETTAIGPLPTSVDSEDGSWREIPRDGEGLGQPPSSGLQPKSVEEGPVQNFEASAVSYPVSRIASESLDDETIASLQQSGLWDTPTIIAAQPSVHSAQNASMMEAGPVQKPIAQFMASLENELSVSPDRLVQAFDELPPGQLQRPREETMGQVVRNLNLPPRDEARALALYAKMLVQLDQADQNELKEPVALPQLNSIAGREALKPSQNLEVKKDLVNRYSAQPVVLNTAEKNFGPTRIDNFKDEDRKSEPVLNYAPGTVVVKAPEAHNREPNMSFNDQGHKSQPDLQQGNQGFAAQASQMMAPAHIEKAEANRFSVKAEKPKTESKIDLNVIQQPAGLTSAPDHTAKDQMDVTSLSAMTGAQMSQAKPAEARHEAIQAIVNNAQLLAQNGGGEMKMTLKPEHLGEIQLRVSMDGPRVDVQMTTEKTEVKRLIEQNAHELRNGLAQHNLNMDRLNVSVNDRNAGNGFGSHQQPDFAAARDFLNQFHGQSHREQMMDFGSFREAARMRSPMTEAPAVSHAERSMRARGSGRLDVVA